MLFMCFALDRREDILGLVYFTEAYVKAYPSVASVISDTRHLPKS